MALTAQHQFYNKSKLDVNIEKTILRVSYKDIVLLQKTANNQLAQLNPPLTPEQEKLKKEKDKREAEERDKKKKEKEEEKKKEEERKQQLVEQTKQIAEAKEVGDVLTLSDMVIKIISHGVQLVVVNDAGDAFMPVLEFTIYEMQILLNQNLILMTGATVKTLYI